MNKNKIRATAFTYWSDDNGCFVTESPLFDRIAGIGETSEESLQMFVDMLDDTYNDVVNGRMRGVTKRGRPMKEGVRLNASIRPSVKESLEEVSKEFDISLGDAIAVAVGHYVATRDSLPTAQEIAAVKELEAQLSELADKFEALVARIDPLVTGTAERRKEDELSSLVDIPYHSSSGSESRISYRGNGKGNVFHLLDRNKQQRKSYAF